MSRIISLFREAFDLCQVDPDESVVVLTQEESREQYVTGVRDALGTMDIYPTILELPGIPSPLYDYGGSPDQMLEVDDIAPEDPATRSALSSADFVVEIMADNMVHSALREYALADGGRMLSISEPPAIVERLFPTAERTERVTTAIDRLEAADTMSVTSEFGTDLRVDLTDAFVFGTYGYTDQPEQRSSISGGFVGCYCRDESYDGRIVMRPGDIILPPNEYVERPIEFRIEAGRVVDIAGEGAGAELVEGYYESWGTEDAYAMSHVGFGLNEAARWEAPAFNDEAHGNDNRSYNGSFMWSTGPNVPVMDRDVRAHFDFPMKGCTIALDGDVVIEAGEFRDPVLRP